MRWAIPMMAVLWAGCEPPCNRTTGRNDGLDDGRACTLMERFPEACEPFDPEGEYGEGYQISFCNNADETCHEDPDVDEFCGGIDNSS